MNWHSLDIDKIFSLMGSSPTGLSPHLVEQKQAECGPNELEEKKKKPAGTVLPASSITISPGTSSAEGITCV